jgi:hypothetical protein
MVSTASTSSNGPIPSMMAATTPFTQSATGPPFSYGMPSSSTKPILSYSTLQTLGLGSGSSNAPLQGSMGGTSASFNAFPYGGGHIPPLSPSLGGAYQHSTRPNTHHSSFGAGSQGLPSHSMLVSSTPFSLFGAFGNNTFSSAAFPVMDNQILCRVLFVNRGQTQEFLPHKDLGILGRDQFSRRGCRSRATPFTTNGTPCKA